MLHTRAKFLAKYVFDYFGLAGVFVFWQYGILSRLGGDEFTQIIFRCYGHFYF